MSAGTSFEDLWEGATKDDLKLAREARRGIWVPHGASGKAWKRREFEAWYYTTYPDGPTITDDDWAEGLKVADELRKKAQAEFHAWARLASLALIDFSNEQFWDPPPPRVFVPGMVLETQVATIYSQGGLGKSLLGLDICVGLTVRGEIFGEPVEPATVLYIDRENSKRGLSKRLRAMGLSQADAKVLGERMHYSLLGALSPLDTLKGGAELADLVERTGAQFVVIDTLSKVIAGEENANDTWNGVHSNTLVYLKAQGITVLQIDHTGKDQEKGQRGGSAKQNNADVIWKLAQVKGDLFSLTCEKDRDGDFDRVLHLIRENEPVLRHRFASEPEVLAAMSGALADKSSEIEDAIVRIARGTRTPYTQNAMMAALREDGVQFNTAVYRVTFKALKERGVLNPQGVYVGESERSDPGPDSSVN